MLIDVLLKVRTIATKQTNKQKKNLKLAYNLIPNGPKVSAFCFFCSFAIFNNTADTIIVILKLITC